LSGGSLLQRPRISDKPSNVRGSQELTGPSFSFNQALEEGKSAYHPREIDSAVKNARVGETVKSLGNYRDVHDKIKKGRSREENNLGPHLFIIGGAKRRRLCGREGLVGRPLQRRILSEILTSEGGSGKRESNLLENRQKKIGGRLNDRHPRIYRRLKKRKPEESEYSSQLK